MTSPGSSMQRKMKPRDLIAFLIEDSQHRVINNERTQNSDQALAAHVKRKGKGKATRAKGDEKALKADSDVVCHNCKKKGHKKADCWAKGGGKEGQGPKQKKGKGKKSKTATVAAVDDNDKELFIFWPSKFPSHSWECVSTVGPAEYIHLTARSSPTVN